MVVFSASKALPWASQPSPVFFCEASSYLLCVLVVRCRFSSTISATQRTSLTGASVCDSREKSLRSLRLMISEETKFSPVWQMLRGGNGSQYGARHSNELGSSGHVKDTRGVAGWERVLENRLGVGFVVESGPRLGFRLVCKPQQLLIHRPFHEIGVSRI